ncbi:DUF4129 domain-containing protein [Haloferula helveola]|uniref:DUF4129 domain-containing protein n=1 Tax=Haloferula helveola TaxID=490095 RepID=A0ABN6H6H9_9BACT|nr:DUF4129 domain-containing protein [Haloferula helveola]
MKLESVTAELRPRSDWEAVDLGIALVRRDFWKLSRAWWLGMTPVLLIGLPLLREHLFWFTFVFWWWIPVASRLSLFKLSRILFGDNPGFKPLLREFPRAIRRRFFYRMIWARFSPWRPLTMAVEDLEGLRGKDYAARCRILMRRGDSSVIMLALWRLALGFWLALTIFCTGMLFVPEGPGAMWKETISLWWEGNLADPPTGLAVAVAGSLCVSFWLVDLFSTGCGFGIYVNYRTWIEGWDVELAFRRLGNRLRGISGVIVASLLFFGLSGGLRAEEPANPKETIERVLQHEDFTVHQQTTKEWQGWDNAWSLGSGLGALGGLWTVLQILFFGGLLFLLGWLIYRFRHVFSGGRGARVPAEPAKARVVMGMEVTAESLPRDVPAAAMAAWREGRHQEAMSLLYRGSISWMIRHGRVEIAESDTENDCLGRVDRAGSGHLGYFRMLTGDWVRLAYARELPSDARVEELCGHWPFREGGQL